MRDLSSPKVIKEILKESGFRFSKSLGQNFLTDSSVTDRMIEKCNITKNVGVIEIGPGFGSLTQRLCMAAGKVVCIEIDSRAASILKNNLSECDNLEIINEDVLKCDLNKIIDEKFDSGEVYIVANLPYYITTPIIMGIFEKKVRVKKVCVMIQKEVAQRIISPKSTKDYGALSVAVNYYSEPSLLINVPPSSFIPPPKVSSAVIEMKLRPSPAVCVNSEKGFFNVVRAAFMQRRKTILNALSNSAQIGLDKEKIREVLRKAGIDETRRGETFDIEEFASLANLIYK